MAKTIQEKISDLQHKIYLQQLKDHEKINRLGWGYSMRCVKMPTFTRSDQLNERLRKLKDQL